VADCIVAADLRGVDVHGVDRIPSYVARIRQGVLDPAAKPESKEITPVVAQVDGKNRFRFVAAYKMAGVNRIYMPGKLEQLIQEERVRWVILYVEAEIEALNEEAKRIGSYDIMVTDREEQTESKN
jgi:LDH2 family malate/lactate/ureidoglycolate dehydrogenase